ncbi:hypothetical protein ABK040_009640 [Willaertia magna]
MERKEIDLDELHYPKLTHLNQIEENVKGVENCITMNHREPFIYVSYENVTSKLFPPIFQFTNQEQLHNILLEDNGKEYYKRLLRREVRGLAFDDETKRIISRTMPKFFNIDESEESNTKRVSYLLKKVLQEHNNNTTNDSPFVILHKLDGSLCSPIIERIEEEKKAFTLDKNNYGSSELEFSREVNVIEETIKKNYNAFRFRMRTKLSHTNPIVVGMEEVIYEMKERTTKEEQMTSNIRDLLENHYSKLPVFPLLLEKEEENDREPLFKINELALVQTPMFTSLSYNAQQFIKFCLHWMNRGFTPLFEYFSHDHKIVIDYGQPFISLLAIRHTVDGYFLPYSVIKQSAEEYGIEYVKECTNTGVLEAANKGDVTKMIEEIRKEKGLEGYVLVLKSGWMFKIKSLWYNDIHKTNSFFSKGEMKEAKIWEIVLDQKVDDMLGFIKREEDRIRLKEFNDIVIERFNQVCENLKKFKEMIIEKLQQQLQQDFIDLEKAPMKDFVVVAKEVLKNEHSYLFNVLLLHKKEPFLTIHGVLKDCLIKGLNKDLSGVKKALNSKDLEFVSSRELRRRMKLANTTTQNEEESNNEEDFFEE